MLNLSKQTTYAKHKVNYLGKHKSIYLRVGVGPNWVIFQNPLAMFSKVSFGLLMTKIVDYFEKKFQTAKIRGVPRENFDFRVFALHFFFKKS